MYHEVPCTRTVISPGTEAITEDLESAGFIYPAAEGHDLVRVTIAGASIRAIAANVFGDDHVDREWPFIHVDLTAATARQLGTALLEEADAAERDPRPSLPPLGLGHVPPTEPSDRAG